MKTKGSEVWRAWNASNAGAPEAWEHWPDFPADRTAQPPATLKAADAAAPWPGKASPKGEDYTARVAQAMRRLVAAAEVLLAVRRRTLRSTLFSTYLDLFSSYLAVI